MQDRSFRETAIALAGHNVALLPHEACMFDALTDSKLELPGITRPEKVSGGTITRQEVEKLIGETLGFPFVILVSQGRLAEAILAKVLCKNATIVPNHGLFPTTKAHFNFNGGRTPEYIHANSGTIQSQTSELDLERLGRLFTKRSAFWIPCVALEACNNALYGKHLPTSHISEVSELTRKSGSSVYLDACRVISNQLIEGGIEQTPEDVLRGLRALCEHVDHMTMSLSKDLPTAVGAVLCTRSPELYYQAYDLATALGSGLSHEQVQEIYETFSNPKVAIDHAKARHKQVELLAATLHEGTNTSIFTHGAHAVFMEAGSVLSAELSNPLQTFLHHLYVEHGVRASINPISDTQLNSGSRVLRFAIPGGRYSNDEISMLAGAVSAAVEEIDGGYELSKVSQPPGLSGAYRARYEVIEK